MDPELATKPVLSASGAMEERGVRTLVVTLTTAVVVQVLWQLLVVKVEVLRRRFLMQGFLIRVTGLELEEEELEITHFSPVALTRRKLPRKATRIERRYIVLDLRDNVVLRGYCSCESLGRRRDSSR